MKARWVCLVLSAVLLQACEEDKCVPVPPTETDSAALVSLASALAPRTSPLSSITREPDPIRLHARVLVPPADRGETLAALTVLPDHGRVYRLVQLRRLPTPEERARLERAGVRLLQVVHDRGYHVSLAAPWPAELLDLVKGAWELGASDRIDPRLAKVTAPQKFTVLVYPDADIVAIAAEASARGGKVSSVSRPFDTIFAAADREGIVRVAAINGVHWLASELSHPNSEAPRAMESIGQPPLREAPYGLTGAGVSVAIHDFGHVFAHPDFEDRWLQADEGSEELGVRQHPTMTAGLIAGGGVVNETLSGAAHGASVYTYSYAEPCCEENNLGDVTSAMALGIDIANNSWGEDGCEDHPYGDYTAAARVFDREVVGLDPLGDGFEPVFVVFSGGNERAGAGADATRRTCLLHQEPPFLNYGTINQPKTGKNTLVVGAIDSATNRASIFSSWGPTSDGRLRPDLVAPGLHGGQDAEGVSNVSNCFGDPVGADNQQCYRTTNSSEAEFEGYAWFSMTSASAALASGTAALFVEDFRRITGREPLPATVKAHLVHGALDLDDDTDWHHRGPDYASGYGLVQAKGAIDLLRTGAWSEACLDVGGEARYYVPLARGAGPLKVTLVWSDVAGDPASAGPALVNDLDLVLLGPDGTRFFPWTLDPANPALAAVRDREDHLNTVEQIVVSDEHDGPLAEGLWRVKVLAGAVPSGPQCFTIVISPLTVEDGDGDGVNSMLDCDDASPTSFPGAEEVCDGVSNDCDEPNWPALAGRERDLDLDGFTACDGDCDDERPLVFPGAPDYCDDVSVNDCRQR